MFLSKATSDDAESDNDIFSTGFITDIFGTYLNSKNDRVETKAAVAVETARANAQSTTATQRTKYIVAAAVASIGVLAILVVLKKKRG